MADDPKTKEVKDFGFIEMSEEAAQKAIRALNGKDINGRRIRVEESKPKPREESTRPGTFPEKH
jgi:RNA recognition motif-containing protein